MDEEVAVLAALGLRELDAVIGEHVWIL